MLDVTNSK